MAANEPISMRVADSIAAYRIVRVNGSHQVTLSTAAADNILGVTQDQATNANQAVPVAISGIAKVFCNDTISAGGHIMTDASGRGIPLVVNTAGVYSVGIALQTVSATGTIADVLINPYQVQIP